MGKQSHIVKPRTCHSCNKEFLYSSKYLKAHALACFALARAALSKKKKEQ